MNSPTPLDAPRGGAPRCGVCSVGGVRMTRGLKRHYGQGHLHFITCSCYRRLPLLGPAARRTAFVRVLGEVRAKYGCKVLGYVVMPEHIHLLISEPAVGTPFTVMKILKQRTARLFRGKRRGTGRQMALWNSENGELRSFWQRRFHDFNVFTAKKKGEKLNYMHMNPVKRGLVEHPKQWLWSSFNFYAQAGTVLLGMNRVE